MNKGIVMKIKKQYAIVLSDHSIYYKIQIKDNMHVGQKLWFLEDDILKVERQTSNVKRSILAIATVAALLAIMIIGPMTSTVPTYAIVSIDINPSLDLKIDEHEDVVEIIPLNGEAKQVTNDEMIGQPVTDVIDEILSLAQQKEYLNDTNNYVLISSAEFSEDSNLSESIAAKLETLEIEGNVKVYFIESDKATAEESLKNGVSLGRLELAKLTKDDKTKKKSVKATIDEDLQEEMNENLVLETETAKWIESLQDYLDELVTIDSPSIEITDFLALEDITTFLDTGSLADTSLYQVYAKQAKSLLKAYEQMVHLANNSLIGEINDLLTYLSEVDGEAHPEVAAFLSQEFVFDEMSQKELAAVKQEAQKLWNSVKQEYKELWTTPDSEGDNSGLVEVLEGLVENLRLIPPGDESDEALAVYAFLAQYDAIDDIKLLSIGELNNLKGEAQKIWKNIRMDYKELWQTEEDEQELENDGDLEEDVDEEEDEIQSLIDSIEELKRKIADLGISDSALTAILEDAKDLDSKDKEELKTIKDALQTYWKKNKNQGKPDSESSTDLSEIKVKLAELKTYVATYPELQATVNLIEQLMQDENADYGDIEKMIKKNLEKYQEKDEEESSEDDDD